MACVRVCETEARGLPASSRSRRAGGLHAEHERQRLFTRQLPVRLATSRDKRHQYRGHWSVGVAR